MVVTLDIVSKVLHAPRVAHPNYPGSERLRTVSKDELMSLFCETPSFWGDRQNTSCSAFAKGPGFLNKVMTFILHPLSPYNTITESHTCFLLSLIEDLSIDFPSHFILSLINVYKGTATCDKLIFPSAIMRLLRHFSIFYPESPHFTFMCAINATTVWRSAAQLRPRKPRIETIAHPASTTPSTFTLSSSTSGVTLKAIMAQLVRMDACLDTLSDKLYQVNTRVGFIAQRQAVMGGFIVASSPSPPTSKDTSDDGSGSDDADEDDDDGSPSDDEMSTSFTCPLSLVPKRGSSFEMRVVILIGGGLV